MARSRDRGVPVPVWTDVYVKGVFSANDASDEAFTKAREAVWAYEEGNYTAASKKFRLAALSAYEYADRLASVATVLEGPE